MPKTKPTYNGSSSDDEGSIYSDTARDENSDKSGDESSDDSSDESSDDEELSGNHLHRVYDDVNALKVAGEWRPGRGQLLGGIVREGKAKYMVVPLEKCDHGDFRFHCEPCDVLLKANSVNAHKKICLGVKKNRKKFKKRWKEAKKRMREEAKEREAKENKKRKRQDGGGMCLFILFFGVPLCQLLTTHIPKELTTNGRGRSQKAREQPLVEPPREKQKPRDKIR